MIKEWITTPAETREDGLDGNVEIKTVRNGWMPGIFEKKSIGLGDQLDIRGEEDVLTDA